jgi:hypothetical protein
MRARYYDPSTAQFVSRDALSSLTRLPYGYVNGSPLNADDPTGFYDCGWRFWNCISPPTSIAQAWNHLTTNAQDPQALGVALTAGLVVGTICVFACEAIPLAAVAKAGTGLVVGTAVAIHEAAEIGMIVFDAWSSPTRDAADSNPNHQDSSSPSLPARCKWSQPGPTEPSFEAPPSDVIRAP